MTPTRMGIVGPTIALALLTARCSTTVMLAPSGARLTLSSTATALAFNGAATISATLVNADGTTPPDGTMVTFSTTLGSLQPAETATAKGVAVVTFNAGPASGTAIVTARSGETGSGDGVRIAVGVAAVARVAVVATPAVVPFGGGTSAITATVTDASGTPLPTIPVTFTTTAGTLTPSSVKTDAKGIAQATLTTSDAATVTATAGPAPSDPGAGTVGTTPGSVAVTVAPRLQPSVSVMPSANPTAQTPTTFTIAATPAAGSTAVIRQVSIAFGDGKSADLGAVSGAAIAVQHVYATGGTYAVTVTAVDSGAGMGTASAVIVVAFQAPLSVAIAPGPVVPAGTNSIVTLTATVTPPTVVIGRYAWNFGDGSDPQSTTGNQVQHIFKNGAGPFTVTVTVTSVETGQTASGFTIINP